MDPTQMPPMPDPRMVYPYRSTAPRTLGVLSIVFGSIVSAIASKLSCLSAWSRARTVAVVCRRARSFA